MISEKSKQYINDVFLGHVTAQAHPVLYATCGIPGVGKTTFVNQQLQGGEFPNDAFIFNPDRVMLALPEYIDDVNIIGAQKAYERWELPVREFSYDMARHARQSQFHVIKDMGCSNPLSLEYVALCKEAGYKVHMFHLECSIDTAFQRIDTRDFKISREAVKERYDLLQNFLKNYQELADSFITIRTDTGQGYEIAS